MVPRVTPLKKLPERRIARWQHRAMVIFRRTARAMEHRSRKDCGTISVCALVPYPENVVPSQRYRIEQWTPHLAEDGIKIDFFPAIDQDLMRLLHKPGHSVEKLLMTVRALPRRVIEALSVKSYDAVLVHRAATIAGPAFIESLVKQLG